MASNPRTPDYTLWVANDNSKGKAGAAWKNEDESISITLDPWTVLRGRGHGGKLTIILFPPGGYDERKAKKEAEAARPEAPISEDDIPF